MAGTHHGYFPVEAGGEVAAIVAAAKPRLVAVAMGCPRQELWLADHSGDLAGILGVACGGSFDVLSGQVVRAPQWVGRLGLEWLYRLLASPRARWRRMGALPRFAARVLSLRLRGTEGGGGADWEVRV